MKQPANPFHPGEILQDELLQPAGITRTAFAGKPGWTRARDYGGVGAGSGGGVGDVGEVVDEFAGDVGSGFGG
jgi:CubicO group peptidase (beta-lactamase class C family)